MFTYISPIVILSCLVADYVMKKLSFGDTIDHLIPAVLVFLGIALNGWLFGFFTLEIVLAGAICGLLAMWFYNFVTYVKQSGEDMLQE